MQDPAQRLLQSSLENAHLTAFVNRLTQWLLSDPGHWEERAGEFTENRAKALLRAADAIDTPALNSFARLMDGGNESLSANLRVALYDLLQESGLAEVEQVIALAATSGAGQGDVAEATVPWISLAVAAFAWKDGYPLNQLDPSAPPDPYSPAGQLLKRAAYFLLRQVQRSATERDMLYRKVAYDLRAGASNVPTLDELAPEQPLAPLPPHFRPPIPVTYPEVARETLHIDEEEPSSETPPVTRGEPISISEEDLEADRVSRMPPVRITPEQTLSPSRRSTRVITPAASSPPLSSFADAVRQRFGRSHEPFASTKLRVVVQEYPDGPGLYGLQVRVTCQGVRSHVAGTTNRQGKFLCELPVRIRSGLTYDVDVTWPKDLGGATERKSITLNADRTEFTLPFYLHIRGEGGVSAIS